jgi:phosphoglucosamine mutase
VLVGRDTRASGPALEASLVRGLYQAGADVVSGGILPTPAVALLSKEHEGAVVSASHNPPEYNGVKFFVDGGRKLTDANEEAIEQLLDLPGDNGGQVYEGLDVDEQYVEIVCERFGTPLAGMRIVADCANGAMYRVAPAVLERLGGQVVIVGNTPDGANINVGCGATDLSLLRDTVRGGDFDLGVAFDGDGDRMLAVDADGRDVDGDQILAVVALHLGVDLVVVTQMTNLGFHRLMEERGVRVVETDVGDRHVAEALRRDGGILGGEQSGHLIYMRGHTSGDGLVATLLLCRAMVERGRTLADLAAEMPKLPQAKTNVPVRSKEIPPNLRTQIDELAGSGRVVVRPSGTEPVVRVLAEAESEKEAAGLCGRIAALVSRELGS